MMENQKVALVTGCSEPSSLGAALCESLLSKGWRVFASARKIEALDGLKEIGCEVSSGAPCTREIYMSLFCLS